MAAIQNSRGSMTPNRRISSTLINPRTATTTIGPKGGFGEVTEHRGQEEGNCHRQDHGHQLAHLGPGLGIGVDLGLGEPTGRGDGVEEGADDRRQSGRDVLLVVVDGGSSGCRAIRPAVTVSK